MVYTNFIRHKSYPSVLLRFVFKNHELLQAFHGFVFLYIVSRTLIKS